MNLHSAPLHRLSGEIGWVVAGNAVAVAGSFASIRILTESLAPSVYGELALGLTVASFASQLLFGPLANGLMRFYAPAFEANNGRDYLISVRRLFLGASIITLAAWGLVVGIAVLQGGGRYVAAISVAFVYATISGFNLAANSMHAARRKRGIVAFHQAAEPWLRCAVVVPLVALFGPTGAVALTVYGCAALLVLLSHIRTLPKVNAAAEMNAPRSVDWRGNILAYTWPFSSWGVFVWGQQSSDRWALNVWRSNHEVGTYAALYQIGYQPVAMVSSLIAQLFAPVLYEAAGDGHNARRNAQAIQRCNRVAVGAVLLALLAAGCCQLLHEPLGALLLASEYRNNSHLLPIVALAGGLFGAGQVASLGLMVGLRTRSLIMTKMGTALFGVAANFLGAFGFGVAGVVWANLLFSAAYLVAVTSTSARMLRRTTRL